MSWMNIRSVLNCYVIFNFFLLSPVNVGWWLCECAFVCISSGVLEWVFTGCGGIKRLSTLNLCTVLRIYSRVLFFLLELITTHLFPVLYFLFFSFWHYLHSFMLIKQFALLKHRKQIPKLNSRQQNHACPMMCCNIPKITGSQDTWPINLEKVKPVFHH